MTVAVRLAHTLLRAVDPLLENNVLICHGLFGSKQNWNSISRALHKSRCGSICTVDLRNHGHSPHTPEMDLLSLGRDILQVVKDLRLHDVCLVGHSLGGKSAMCAALLDPSSFSRMIVLDTSPLPTSEASTILYFLDLMLSADLHRASRESDGSLGGVRQWLSNLWRRQLSDEKIISFLLTNLDRIGDTFVWRVNLQAIKLCWHSLMEFPATELRGRVFDKPTLFVAADRSAHLRLSDFSEIARYFPRSRFVCIRGAGHWLHADKPQTIQNLISRFVKCPMDELIMDGVEDLTEQAYKYAPT